MLVLQARKVPQVIASVAYLHLTRVDVERSR